MIHDPELLDYLSEHATEAFHGNIYRATRKSLDPLAPSSSGGRWAARGGCTALYTSLTREGALAEISFHWGRLTPLPSKPVALHTLNVSTEHTLRLVYTNLTELGIDIDQYSATNYARTQEIGAAACFLGYDGLIVPSARWQCDNLILYANNISHTHEIECINTEEVQWQIWATQNGGLSDQV